MMEDVRTTRRLAAIFIADVVGYSRMMANDETATLTALKQHRKSDFDPAVARHRGRIVKLIGDGTLVEFGSVVDAVECAVDIQQAAATVNQPTEPKIVLRIGINLGDVILEEDDIYGNGVNIASRLEPLAKPGGIAVSSIVKEIVGGRSDIKFKDGGEVQVKNIDRPIHVWQWHSGDSGTLPSTKISVPSPVDAAPAPKTDAVSIAVLPFENMSGDAEQEYFSDGITEDIITDLSKVSGLMVIARNSTFAYKGQSVDLRTVGRELGVATVLEGSVRRAGNRVRITAQLIDASNGSHIWAERYDRDLDDIFAVQDEVTLSIVGALKVALNPEDRARLAEAGTKSLEAHDYFLKARGMLMAPNVTADVFHRAVKYGQLAIELDPDFAQAHAILALANSFDYFNRWSDDPENAAKRSNEHSARAVELAPNDPFSHLTAAYAAVHRGDFEMEAAELEKALVLVPNYAGALLLRGTHSIYAGRPQEAFDDLERAMRLDPGFSHHPLHFLGLAHYILGNFEAAKLMFQERLVLAKDTDIGRAFLAATHGQLGEIDEAKQVWADLMKIDPKFDFPDRLARQPFENQSYRDKISEGLAKAGLPTG
jgi:adenylate cyclase